MTSSDLHARKTETIKECQTTGLSPWKSRLRKLGWSSTPKQSRKCSKTKSRPWKTWNKKCKRPKGYITWRICIRFLLWITIRAHSKSICRESCKAKSRQNYFRRWRTTWGFQTSNWIGRAVIWSTRFRRPSRETFCNRWLQLRNEGTICKLLLKNNWFHV